MKVSAFFIQCKKFLFYQPAVLVLSALLFPLFLFLFRVESLQRPRDIEWLSAFFWTFIQAGLTVFFSLILALFSVRGLLVFHKKPWYLFLEAICLIPCLIPPLLMVLSLIHLTGWLFPFPFGIGALIFVQTMTYAGLSAVALTRVLLKEAPAVSGWAWLSGASPWLFLRAVAQTLLRKDIKILAVLIFTGAWTGLSLPLLTAGGKNISLEFYIYKLLKDPSLWPQAGALILIQTLLVLAICLRGFAGRPPALTGRPGAGEVYLLPRRVFILIPLIFSFLSVGGLIFFPSPGVFKNFQELTPLLISAGGRSLLVGFGVGACMLAGFAFMALSFSNKAGRKLVASYISPGASLTGFAFLLLPLPDGGTLWKWTAGLSLLIFPLVYRFRGESVLEKLTLQVETARLCGAGWGLVFQDIVWPQCRRTFFFCSGLAGFWAVGDFAYSLIVSNGEWNLALVVYDLLSSYRIDLAVLTGLVLLTVCFFVLLFWTAWGYLLDRKEAYTDRV